MAKIAVIAQVANDSLMKDIVFRISNLKYDADYYITSTSENIKKSVDTYIKQNLIYSGIALGDTYDFVGFKNCISNIEKSNTKYDAILRVQLTTKNTRYTNAIDALFGENLSKIISQFNNHPCVGYITSNAKLMLYTKHIFGGLIKFINSKTTKDVGYYEIGCWVNPDILLSHLSSNNLNKLNIDEYSTRKLSDEAFINRILATLDYGLTGITKKMNGTQTIIIPRTSTPHMVAEMYKTTKKQNNTPKKTSNHKIDYSLYRDINDVDIDWSKYVDHIYCVHANIHTNDNNNELKRLGLLNNELFSFHYYTLDKKFNEYQLFKKCGIIEALLDAYNKGYEKVLLFTDDMKFIRDTQLIKALNSIDNEDLCILNPGDICEDMFYCNRTFISYVTKLKIQYNNNWYEDFKKSILKSGLDIRKSDTMIAMHKIDYVFPYVDNNDKEWQNIHNIYKGPCKGESNTINRYRSWDNLIYVFRGIEKNLPFINKVHFIVMQDSQVPKWINRENVHIVYHKDYIPEKFLPTFNSCTLELFMNNIPELSEYYLYGNDDTFPILELYPNELYENGYPRIRMSEYNLNYHTRIEDESFNRQCENSYLISTQEFADIHKTYRPAHTIIPIIKTSGLHLWKLYDTEFENSISMFREHKNINQYIYTNYKYAESNYKFTHISNMCKYLNMKNIQNVVDEIKSQKSKILCINDAVLTAPFEFAKEHINNALSSVLKNNSDIKEKYIQ